MANYASLLDSPTRTFGGNTLLPRVEVFDEDTPEALGTAMNVWLALQPEAHPQNVTIYISNIEFQTYIVSNDARYAAMIHYGLLGVPV